MTLRTLHSLPSSKWRPPNLAKKAPSRYAPKSLLRNPKPGASANSPLWICSAVFRVLYDPKLNPRAPGAAATDRARTILAGAIVLDEESQVAHDGIDFFQIFAPAFVRFGVHFPNQCQHVAEITDT